MINSVKNVSKILLVSTTLLIGLSGTSNASCNTFGGSYSSYTYCSDGNTYQKLGNSLYGHNSNTGSSWSQHSFGNSVYGTDSSGSSWSCSYIGGRAYCF